MRANIKLPVDNRGQSFDLLVAVMVDVVVVAVVVVQRIGEFVVALIRFGVAGMCILVA